MFFTFCLLMYSTLIFEGWLPEEQAINCEYEYSLLINFWTELLDPYYK